MVCGVSWEGAEEESRAPWCTPCPDHYVSETSLLFLGRMIIQPEDNVGWKEPQGVQLPSEVQLVSTSCSWLLWIIKDRASSASPAPVRDNWGFPGAECPVTECDILSELFLLFCARIGSACRFITDLTPARLPLHSESSSPLFLGLFQVQKGQWHTSQCVPRVAPLLLAQRAWGQPRPLDLPVPLVKGRLDLGVTQGRL